MILELLAWLCFPLAMLFFGWATEEEDEHWFIGTVVSGGLMYFMVWVWKIPVITLMRENIVLILKGLAVYILIGIVWSMIKVYFTARKINPKELKDTEKMDKGTAKSYEFKQVMKCTPKWIAFWPSSLAWSIVSNWFKELFVWISDRLKKVYIKLFELGIREKAMTEAIEKENPFND